MYYSDETLEKVRSASDIVDVISAYVKLKKQGSVYFGLCPFHNEKSPSFSVTPRKEMFYCFGCHKGGSVFTFIQLYENCSFPEAVEMLAQRARIDLPQESFSGQAQKRRQEREALLEINKKAATFYYYQLRSESGRPGMQYLKGRQLSDGTMKSFGLGYAPQTDDMLYRYMKSQEISEDLLQRSGLFIYDERRGVRDKFWNRVMFPIQDTSGRVIGFGGRVMGDGKPKYLNSPESEVFNKRRNLYALHLARRSSEKYMILCEGYMDVIALHQAGFTNAAASLGTALTMEHAALLKKYTQQVVLSYDSDNAGVNAALRAIPMLKSQGMTVKILHLEPYKDPDEFIKALGADALRERIKQAQNSFLFEIQVLKRSYHLNDPDEKTRFQMAAAEKIAAMETEAERDNYTRALAEECMMSYDALRQLVLRALARGIVPGNDPVERERQREERLEQRRERERNAGVSTALLASERLLLTWLTEYPHFYEVLKTYVNPEDYATPFYRECALLLYEQLENHALSEVKIIDHFENEEDQEHVAELFHARADMRSEEELRAAMAETIRKVSDDAMKRRAKDGRGISLQETIAAKKRSEALKHLQIDLSREA